MSFMRVFSKYDDIAVLAPNKKIKITENLKNERNIFYRALKQLSGCRHRVARLIIFSVK